MYKDQTSGVMDLAVLEQQYIATLGSVGTPAMVLPSENEMPNPDHLVSVWRSPLSAVAHQSLRGLIETPAMVQAPATPDHGPRIGLSILAPLHDSDVLPDGGTIVSSPVLENKKFAFGRPEFTQWEPKM